MNKQELILHSWKPKRPSLNTSSRFNSLCEAIPLKSLAETIKEINTDRQNACYARIGVLSLIQYNSSRLMLVPKFKIQGQVDFQ